MSSALASAKRKRAVQETTVAPQNNISQQNIPGRSNNGVAQQAQPSGPLTVPQAFALVERRLKTLELFMEKVNSQSNNNDIASSTSVTFTASGTSEQQNIPDNLVDILDEYNARFDILAEEISNLKNIVLSLQSYTMEVNKTLMEERIRVLSNTDDTNNVNELEADVKQITLEEALAVADNL